MFRSSPPDLSPTKTLSKYGANPQEKKNQFKHTVFPLINPVPQISAALVTLRS